MQIQLYDTTLRDGTQREGMSLSAEDKVKIARELDALGISYIEGGWPGSNPKDAEFFQRIQQVELKHAKVAAFGSTRHHKNTCDDDPNIRALVEANTPVVTLVGKSSTLHVEKVLETTLDENVRMISDSVAYFKQLGKEVIYDAEHFFDGYKLDAEYALETIVAAARAGANCDRAVRHQRRLAARGGGAGGADGARAPRGRGMRDGGSAVLPTPNPHLPSPTLGIHTHNDGALAVANAMAAVRAGCVQVQGTINGYGERCGNMDLIPLIANLQIKQGYQCVAPSSCAG